MMMTSTKVLSQMRKLPVPVITRNLSSAVDRTSYEMPPETLELMRKLNAASSNGSYNQALGIPSYGQWPSKQKSEAYEVWHTLVPKKNFFQRTVYYRILYDICLLGMLIAVVTVWRLGYKYLTPPEKRLKYKYRLPSFLPYLHEVGESHNTKHH